MRFRVVLATALFVFALAPLAHAATLPDLPGMDAAKKAIGNRSATTSSTSSTPTRPSTPTGGSTVGTTSNSVGSDAAKAIRNLPGTGAVPVIERVDGGLSRSDSPIASPDSLLVLAAFGSFAALGSLCLLRRLGRA